MGVTNFEIQLLEKIIKGYKKNKPNSPMFAIELGAQSLYIDNTDNPPFASEWYLKNGVDFYESIDLAGDNNSFQLDLAFPLPFSYQFDLVTDFGTSCHVVQMDDYVTVSFNEGHINSIYPKEIKNIELGYYNCWLNKHNLLKEDGIMINVNPMSGHWEGHGYSYLGEKFYNELVKISGYELIETGLNGATGNWETGLNVYGVIKKFSNKFPSFEEFNRLPIYKY